MTEVANRNTAALDLSPANVLGTPGAGTIQLAEWAMELTAAHQLGTALCQTDFVPAAFKGKPEAAAAAILAGKSLGLDPMNALANIFVVHGKPALYARTMAALILREGHEVIRTAATNDSVTVKARRKGTRDWQEFTWDIARATQAKYMTNEKYRTNPIEMLTAKALAEACRVIAPDVLTGVAAYSVEEVELEDMGERQQAPAKEQPLSASARLAAAAAEAAPPEPAEPTAEPLCSRKQQTDLGNALKALGHTTKDEMLGVVSAWVGREISGSRDLTVGEAKQLTEELLAEAAEKNQAAEDVVDADGVVTEPAAVDAEADAAWLAGTN
ncbi:hypothetical protein [Arthrobacter burdickii]|uniref:RecT family protein n=1 Tax=Arthrobacter burdickii TaxID=3035920 RepID=A0ABT8K4J7_9MICC|nr:hypothetical protein [Arthrobacter burdickii]MDN4611923.1 hypothetical protein [Arthrobacter burdickii]